MQDFKILAGRGTIFWENWGLRTFVWKMFQEHENVAEGLYFLRLKNFWQYEQHEGTISELGHMKSKWCISRNRHMTLDVGMLDVDADVQCAVNRLSDGAFRSGNASLHAHSIIERSQKFETCCFLCIIYKFWKLGTSWNVFPHIMAYIVLHPYGTYFQNMCHMGAKPCMPECAEKQFMNSLVSRICK